jgi:hypothetical protein
LIPNPLPGDFDRNGFVTSEDFDYWRAHFGNGGFDAAAYVLWRKNLGKTIVPTISLLPGDGDRDGDVDQADWEFWKANFGKTGTNAADYNGNGLVDAADYVIWRKYEGRTILPQLLEEYRRERQANANALIDAIPAFYGPYGFVSKPQDIPGKIAVFNWIMENWEPELLEVKTILFGYTQHPQYDTAVSPTLRNRISAFLGYMDEGNAAGFYGQWESFDAFLRNFADYLTIIANAKTVRMLQIIPPFYGSVGAGASVPILQNDEPSWIAQDNWNEGKDIIVDVCMEALIVCMSGGSAGDFKAPPAENAAAAPQVMRLSYPISSSEPPEIEARASDSEEQKAYARTELKKLKEQREKTKEKTGANVEAIGKGKIQLLVPDIYYEVMTKLESIATIAGVIDKIKSLVDEYLEKRFFGRTSKHKTRNGLKTSDRVVVQNA